MLTGLARAITGLNRWIGKTASWFILPLFVLLLADVTLRYFIGRPAVWTSEFAQLMFGVYAILGGGYLLAERGHVNVDILYGSFSKRRKAIADICTSFLFFIFVGVLLYQGVSLGWVALEKLETSHSVWNPPVWPVKLAIPIAATLLLLQGVVRLVADIRVLMGLENDPEIYGADAAEDEKMSEGAEL
jgi:TRAP-type mannitol/chloroaromatic compound transport system permease small subunit